MNVSCCRGCVDASKPAAVCVYFPGKSHLEAPPWLPPLALQAALPSADLHQNGFCGRLDYVDSLVTLASASMPMLCYVVLRHASLAELS